MWRGACPKVGHPSRKGGVSPSELCDLGPPPGTLSVLMSESLAHSRYSVHAGPPSPLFHAVIAGTRAFIALSSWHLADTAFSLTLRGDPPPTKRLQFSEGSNDG